MAARSPARPADPRTSVVRRPRAPPCQHAATPIPPHAKPGRVRYQPGAPTGSAGVASNRTGALTTLRSPRATQAPGGCAVTDGWRRLTRNSWRSSLPTWAVTSAASSRAASEHQGLTPVSVTCPPLSRASSRCGAASAAKTPQVPSGVAAPASLRIARASLCASRTLATVRLCSPAAASTAHRRAVSPQPGCGSSLP